MSQATLELTDRRLSFRRVKPEAGVTAYGQYMTPLWLAEAIVEKYFMQLPRFSHVLEPSCGIGRFLDAIYNVAAGHLVGTGIEVDPELARIAQRRHEVTCGDFLEVEFYQHVDAIIGNPPFQSKTIDAFLKRSHELLAPGGIVGFILPTYYFQSATRTDALNRRWSLAAEQIPRSVFPGLSEPLCFTLLTKDRRRKMVGFAFYGTAAAIQRWGREYRELAVRGSDHNGNEFRSVWRQVVDAALKNLGGESDLPTLYAEIEKHRPTPNPHWRAKVRQVVQLDCDRTGRGRWARRAA